MPRATPSGPNREESAAFRKRARVSVAGVLPIFCWLLACAVCLHAQTEEWRATFDSSLGAPPNLFPAWDIGTRVGFDAAGNVYVVTRSAELRSPNLVEMTVFKYDSLGNEEWRRDGFYGSFSDFQVDPAGTVYLSYSYEDSVSFNRDAFLSRISGNGVVEWIQGWNYASRDKADHAVDIAVDVAGNAYHLIKTDVSSTSSINYDSALVKYSSAGQLLWEVYGWSGSPAPKAVELDSAGHPWVLEDGKLSRLSQADGSLLCMTDVHYWWDDDGLDTNPAYWADAEGVDLAAGTQRSDVRRGEGRAEALVLGGAGNRSIATPS